MEAYFSREQLIGVSMCDASGRLGIANTFALFQDIASEHAEILGVGNRAMQEKQLFWVTARTRVHFYNRPALMENTHVETWPIAPGAMRCDRCYRLSAGETLLAEGRTEWCVLDVASGKVTAPSAMFGPDVVYRDELLLPAPYSRYRHDFTDADLAFTHTVRSTNVDIGRHMNNVAYLRLLCDSFSVQELEQLNLQEMEIWFCMSCFEGDTLSVFRRKTDFGYEFGIRRPDGRYAALAVARA